MSTVIDTTRHHWLGALGLTCAVAGLHGLSSGPLENAHAAIDAPHIDSVRHSLTIPLESPGTSQTKTAIGPPVINTPKPVVLAKSTAPVMDALDSRPTSRDDSFMQLARRIDTALAPAVATEPNTATEPGAVATSEPLPKLSPTAESKKASPPETTSAEDKESDLPAKEVAATPTTKSYKVRNGDSLAAIFKRAGLPKATLANVLTLEDSKRYLRKIHPGDVIRISQNGKGELDTLSYEIDAFHTLIVFSDEENLASTIETASRETKTATASGTIKSSLFLAAKDAGLSNNLVMELVDIFGWDIDFAQDLRSGDRFSVVYEEILRNGEKISDGRVIAAAFVNQGQEHRAIRFEHSSRSGFYSPDGKALRKAFLRNPVKFSRISSRFTLKRWHPILKKWRAHRGVDYAAPTGTPIRATGDGKIKSVGWMNGYGRVIMIQHGKRYLTVYGHLSRFARGLKKGKRVRQGQLIGYVGKSGYATGPHLHYEFRVDGRHRDPLRVKLPGAPSLPKKLLTEFRQAAAPHIGTLNRLEQTVLAKNDVR